MIVKKEEEVKLVSKELANRFVIKYNWIIMGYLGICTLMDKLEFLK